MHDAGHARFKDIGAVPRAKALACRLREHDCPDCRDTRRDCDGGKGDTGRDEH
jgi:hypothetical protein